MAALSFVEGFLQRNCPFIHGRRRGALVRVVDSLVGGSMLYLSALGRAMAGPGRTKNKIKLVDRLLGNTHLHAERGAIYQALASWVLSGRSRPVIAVDWSDVELGNRYQMLKAAVAIEGRALTLYEEVHSVAGVSRARAERIFLKRLAKVIPPQCRPIIVTDAGFHGPWFAQVRALGWDYVGRLRNRVKVRLGGDDGWRLISTLYPDACARAKSLGMAEVAHRAPYPGHLCLFRGHRSRPGRRRADRPKNNKWREPWLLVSSLDPQAATATQIVNVYAKRMQIEETFRDIKEGRWSFAMSYARSRTMARREALLLIATLALFALWLAGVAARALDWHRHFQANTVRDRHVLSVVFLGRAVLADPRYELNEPTIQASAQLLRASVIELYDCR